MAGQLKLRRGTTSQLANYNGSEGELTYDTQTKQLRVHDGSTVGGKIIDVDECLTYMPIPYPKSTPPNGYLALMGQSISQQTYPKLYSLYGATLPDLRAYTIRGLDNGRGIDVGRNVLSEQQDAIRNITGSVGLGGVYNSLNPSGALGGTIATQDAGASHSSVISGQHQKVVFNASLVVPTATENRVKNIAFLYIVKAG